ncbi:MAG: hypothetical protein JKY81_09600 [Colwellia sp.]|nr:hypothetical protein [Colwellia sp.]
MDGFTFTTEIVKALAWPVSAIVLVFLLRKPIIELVPLMKKLKYKELELEFSQEVKALKLEVTESSGVGSPTVTVSPSTNSKALDLLSFSTRAAIMEAWIEVETAATEVASSFWGQSPNETMKKFSKLGEYLHQCNVIDDKQLITFQRLRQLRNKVAHVRAIDLNEEDAKSFIVMAEHLAKHIKGA